MKLIASVDELLALCPNLNVAVSILIRGLSEKGDTETLMKWDQFRSEDYKEKRHRIFNKVLNVIAGKGISLI